MTLQSLRLSRGHTRVEFLRTLRAVTGEEVKLRTLRAWESGQTEAPAWVVGAYRAVLGLSPAEVDGLVASLSPASVSAPSPSSPAAE